MTTGTRVAVGDGVGVCVGRGVGAAATFGVGVRVGRYITPVVGVGAAPSPLVAVDVALPLWGVESSVGVPPPVQAITVERTSVESVI
jgi:hypothetical protein